MWCKEIFTPIPKCSTSDPRDPLSYRGITLTLSAYKLYCSILNNRLLTWWDTRDSIHDEQNGFRKSKSTIDHLSTLTCIIETRKLRKLSTFAVFVDFKKAYDTVNRSLLFRDLNDLCISKTKWILLKLFILKLNVQLNWMEIWLSGSM